MPSRLVALGKVLILAHEEVVAALLGLMVELRGSQPRFLGRVELAEDVIRRETPIAVLIDCDYPDCGDELLKAIRKAGAIPILFSPFRIPSEVESFTLPTDIDTFGRVLEN